MSVFLVIIFFICWIKYVDHLRDNAINRYDMKQVDTLKLTMDMNKPLHVREQNLLAGRYDFKPGEYNWKTKQRM